MSNSFNVLANGAGDGDEGWTVVNNSGSRKKDRKKERSGGEGNQMAIPYDSLDKYPEMESVRDDQDWKEFITKKRQEKQKPSGKVEVEAETEVFRHKKINPVLSKKIQQYRTTHKLSQRDLAMKMNLTEDVIRDYELGVAIPDGQILGKFHYLLNREKKVVVGANS